MTFLKIDHAALLGAALFLSIHAAGATAAPAAEGYTLGLPLRPGGTGVERGHGVVSLPEARLVGDGGVVLGLEDAELVVRHPRTGLIPAEPSGALAFDDGQGPPHLVSWAFAMEAPGAGDLWVKIEGSVAGLQMLLWTLLRPDADQAGQSRFDFPEDEDGALRWIRVGEVAMDRPGEYRLHCRMPHEGCRLLAAAILPAGVEPADAAVAAGSLEVDEGEVFSKGVRLPDARAVTGMEVAGWNGQGEVRLALAFDDGDWHWVEHGKLPEALQAGAREPGETVRARAVLRRTDSGAPQISGLDLRVRGGLWPVLESPVAVVHLDRHGGLFRIRDRAGDRDLLWTAEPVFPFSLDLKQPGRTEWSRYRGDGPATVRLSEGRESLAPEALAEALAGVADEALETAEAGADGTPAGIALEGFEEMADGGWRFDYTVAGEVRLSVTHRLADGEYQLDTELHNADPTRDLIRFTFPRLKGIRLGSDGFDDDQLRMQTFGHLKRVPGLATVRDEKYPGSLALPWEAVDDPEGGLALISLDPSGRNLGFASRPSGFFSDTSPSSTKPASKARSPIDQRTASSPAAPS